MTDLERLKDSCDLCRVDTVQQEGDTLAAPVALSSLTAKTPPSSTSRVCHTRRGG
jgi:hypothetical protein